MNINIESNELSVNLLLGFRIKDENFKLINLICLEAKYYIYIQRNYGNNEIYLCDFLIRLKMKLLAIKKIVNKLKEKIFAKQIEILLDNL
jgi:hypothetical protein